MTAGITRDRGGHRLQEHVLRVSCKGLRGGERLSTRTRYIFGCKSWEKFGRHYYGRTDANILGVKRGRSGLRKLRLSERLH